MRLLRAALVVLAFGATAAQADLFPSGLNRLSSSMRGHILGGSLGIANASLALGSGSGGVFDSGNAEGWVVQSASAAAGQTFAVTRQGFTTAGAATTYTDTFTVTAKLRQAYSTGFPGSPMGAVTNAAPLNTNNLWALSDYVLGTDTPSGFVNNSTLTAPPPLCNWDEPSRMVVGNSLHASAVCFSRYARSQSEIASLVFSASDGTNTRTCTASGMTKSAYPGDQNAVLDYECTIDITGLTDNHLVTLNGKAYSWIGDSASVLDSSTNTVLREFSPRYYLKNTTRAAAPYYAYVCPAVSVGSCPATAASDSTGKWSTDAPTAAGLPFATYVGALNAISGGNGTPGGVADGAIVRFGAGTSSVGQPTSARIQNVAAITLTRDPSATRASVILSMPGSRMQLATGGTLTAPVTEAAMYFKDVSILRAGSSSLVTTAGGTQPDIDLIFDNVNYDNGSTSNTTTLLAHSHLYAYGMAVTNLGANALASNGAPGTTEIRILRGVTASGGTLDPWLLLGSTLTNTAGLNTGSSGGRSGDGSIIAFNQVLNPNPAQAAINFGTNFAVIRGAALVQNLFECDGTNVSAGLAFYSGDASGNNVSNMIVQYNTFTGAAYVGRQFYLYDQTVGFARTHRFPSALGNIFNFWALKTDWFDAQNKGDTTTGINSPQNRTGTWAALYGVGFVGNLHQYLDVANGGFGGSFMQAYPGLAAKYNATAASNTVWFNPLFVNYQATTVTLGANELSSSSYTGGAGGGDYHRQAGSPCNGAVPVAGLAFTLDGTARPATNDNCGAY